MSYRRLPDEGPIPPMRIYDASVRLCHWAYAALVMVLIVSGYLIGTPLASTNGDTSQLYSLGWLRFAHLAGGQAFTVFFLFRALCAFTGNAYARDLFVPAVWRRSWTEGLVEQIAWTLWLVPRAPRYLGLNPLANAVILLTFILPSVLTILTGYAMLAEVTGHESWQYALFGWMVSIFGNTLDLHILHRLCMWVILCFILIHVYTVVRDDIFSRQSTISTMLSGFRTFRR